jgi:hypothetical protein
MASSSRVASFTAATNIVASTGPCRVSQIILKNETAAAKTVQLHNAASLPANTAVPEFSYALASSGELIISFNEPHFFSTGLVVASSSTNKTLTISLTADLVGTVVFNEPH